LTFLADRCEREGAPVIPAGTAVLQSCPAAQGREAQPLGVIVALGKPTVLAVTIAWPNECVAPRNAVTVIEPS